VSLSWYFRHVRQQSTCAQLIGRKNPGQNQLVNDLSILAVRVNEILALDANGIFECARSGGEVTPTYLSTPRPGRSLAEYPYRLEDLLFAIDAMARPDEFYPLSYPQDGWLQSARAVDGAKSETN